MSGLLDARRFDGRRDDGRDCVVGRKVAAGTEEESVEAGRYHLTPLLLTLKVEHASSGPTISATAALAGDLQESWHRLPLDGVFQPRRILCATQTDGN